jgi:hypothetical protein
MNTKRPLFQFLLTGLLIAVALNASEKVTYAQYVYQTINIPGAYSSQACGINDAGVIVGSIGGIDGGNIA